MWYAWGRIELHIGVWWGSWKERVLGNLDADGRQR
jgi:hypothetical protein